MPLQEQQAGVPLQEQWFVPLQAQIWVVALHEAVQDALNAFAHITPNASPRMTGTSELTIEIPKTGRGPQPTSIWGPNSMDGRGGSGWQHFPRM